MAVLATMIVKPRRKPLFGLTPPTAELLTYTNLITLLDFTRIFHIPRDIHSVLF